jgi:HlyD family secretion protein
MKKWIIAIIAVIVIVALAMLSRQGVTVRTAEVKKGTVRACVEERARTTLPRIYHITMPLDGRIMPITLTPGTAVKKEQVIATMDDSKLRTLLTETKAQAEAIKREIVLNKYNAIEETALKESSSWNKVMHDAVSASWKKAEASKAQRQYAEWYFGSTEKMKQAISGKERHRAQMEAAQNRVNHEAGLITYNAMRTCEEMFKLIPVYIRQYLGRKELNREILKERLNEVEAALGQVERDLKRTAISSPIDGVVLKRYVQNEQVMKAGEKLLDIGDLSQLEVTADILSIYAAGIKPGNPVEIHGPAVGKSIVHGKVIRIHPYGFTRVSSLGVREQRVPVDISIDKSELEKLLKQDRVLGVGFRVQIRIITGESKDVLTVPSTALFRGDNGKWRVFAVVDNHAVEKEVETGTANYAETEITGGLNSGDTVITAPPADVRNGTKVSL